MKAMMIPFFALFIKLFRKRTFLNPDGRAIFISGCDSGIGKKLAEYFSEMGCLVFAGCLDPSRSRSSLPDKVRVIPLNLLEDASVKEAVASVQRMLEEEKKELWALVNNAGVCVMGLFEWQTDRQRDLQVNVNFSGTMNLTYKCKPLLERSRGRIITITSVNGSIAYPGLAVYSATKHALEGWSDGIRTEMGSKHGIRVITVQPGDYARVTSIMSQHRSHAREMWDNMPRERQEREGEEFKRYHSATLQKYGLSSPTSWEGSPLIRDMKEAVLGENPSSKYLSAPLAHKFVYKFMAWAPTWCTDFLLTSMTKLMIKFGANENDDLTL